MAIKKNIKGLMFVAALGTMLGSLGSLLYPNNETMLHKMRRRAKGFAQKGENFFSDVKNWSEPRNGSKPQNFLNGTLLGMLLGAGSALLFTPKTGKQFRKDLNSTTQNMMHMVNTKNIQLKRLLSRRLPSRSRITHAKRRVTRTVSRTHTRQR